MDTLYDVVKTETQITVIERGKKLEMKHEKKMSDGKVTKGKRRRGEITTAETLGVSRGLTNEAAVKGVFLWRAC